MAERYGFRFPPCAALGGAFERRGVAFTADLVPTSGLVGWRRVCVWELYLRPSSTGRSAASKAPGLLNQRAVAMLELAARAAGAGGIALHLAPGGGVVRIDHDCGIETRNALPHRFPRCHFVLT